MSDETEIHAPPSPAPVIAQQPAATKPDDKSSKLERAAAIYVAWRNKQLNGIDRASFDAVERASKELIEAIAAEI